MRRVINCGNRPHLRTDSWQSNSLGIVPYNCQPIHPPLSVAHSERCSLSAQVCTLQLESDEVSTEGVALLEMCTLHCRTPNSIKCLSVGLNHGQPFLIHCNMCMNCTDKENRERSLIIAHALMWTMILSDLYFNHTWTFTDNYLKVIPSYRGQGWNDNDMLSKRKFSNLGLHFQGIQLKQFLASYHFQVHLF